MKIPRKAANSKTKANESAPRDTAEDSPKPRDFEAWLTRYRRRLEQICDRHAQASKTKRQ